MANSVGTVSIDLEARIAKFESDLGRAARIADQRSQEMRKMLGSVAGALGAGFSIAGITSFVKSALDAQDAISKMAQKVGVSTEALSGWELAAKQAGIESEGFQKGLVKLAQSSAMVLQGSKQQTEAFKSLGVSVLDSKGHLKDLDTLFPEVIDKLSKFHDGVGKTAVATQLFGRAGADLIPLFNAGAKGLAEYTKMAEDFGLVVGSKSAKAAEDFNDHLEQLGFVAKGVANQLATELAPALAELATKAVAFFRSNRWKETLADISTGAKYVADHIGDIINAVKLLGQIVTTVYAGKLLKLGVEWIGNLTAQGVAVDALGAKTTLSLGATIKNIWLLRTGLNLVGAAVVGWQIGTYLYNQFQIVRDAGAILVGTILVGWELVKKGATLMALGMEDDWNTSLDTMKKGFVSFIHGVGKSMEVLSPTIGKALSATLDSFVDGTGSGLEAKLTKTAIARMKAVEGANASIAKIRATTWQGVGSSDGAPQANPLDGLTTTKKGLDLVNDAATAAAKALDAYNKKQDALSATAATAVSGYIGKTETPDVKAWNDYAAVVQKVAEAEGQRIQTAIDAQKAGVAGIDVAKVEAAAQRDMVAAIDQLAPARDKATAAAERQMAVGTELANQAMQQAVISGMSERDADIYRAGLDTTNKLLAEGVEVGSDYFNSQKQIAEQGAAAAYDLTQQAQFTKQVAQEYAGFWENATSSISRAIGDLATSGLRKWKDFGSSLKSVAQQFVSDIIAQFVRLRILGPLLSGSMTTVAGWLGIGGSLAASSINQSSNYYGSGSTISGAPNAMGGGNTSYAGFAGNLSAARSAYSMANGVSWLGSGTSTGNIASVGVNPSTGVATAYNPWAGAQPAGGTIAGYSTAGLAGGLAGAYWGSQRGSGGFSTAASTVTGAVGGYAAGTAAATAIGSGVAAGMAAIPVVGWIALAAMLVDQVSGGKLFGTKYQATAADQMLSLTSTGGAATQSITEKRQGALFSGAKWKTTQQAASPEVQAAADALYDSISKSMVQGAQKLAVDVPAMINASLNIHSNISKGKVTSTDYIVDYLGRTWKEATAEAAQQRIGAEAIVAVVQQSAGAAAQTIAEQFRASAATLADGAQLMLEAQADINKGSSLVALGAQATLSQVVAFAQMMQADGESLADTYTRLSQASASYLQFVNQFSPTGATFADSLKAINDQMMANIDQANTLAQAAGLSAAREQDLANIHQYAAQQAAAAITALSASAQDLSTKLYGSVQSLSKASVITDQLTAKMQQAAQLAIGDNSPLSGKQKLDVALQGLRSGVTSADDVLSLGRKLYASSSDYTGLYNKVTDILGLPSASGGTDDITSALANYNKLSAQATASSRFGDAKTLAQNIADISSSQGVGYNEIASGLGVNLQQLGKDLGLTNIAGYLDSLQQQDIGQSMVTSSATIVDAIQGIGHDIVQAILGGPLATSTTTAKPAAQSSAEQTALLQSINARLAAIEGSSATTANTNTTMVKQATTDALRATTTSSRKLTVAE